MNITKTLRGLFSLAAVDWMMFVWVCTKIRKTSKFRLAIEDDVMEMVRRPSGFSVRVREAAYLMLLQCEGAFPLSFLIACIKTKRPHVVTLAKLRAVQQGLLTRVSLVIMAELPDHSGDLLEIARSKNCNEKNEHNFRNAARLKLLVEEMRGVSHADVCSWAMAPYEPHSISVSILADFQFCIWFDLPGPGGQMKRHESLEVALYAELRSKTYLSKEGSGAPCAWRIAPELLAQAKFS